MKFTKMQGAGNNYIYINCLEHTVENPEELSRFVSDIRFGIGSDGLILIKPSDKADFFMDIYNADGSRAMMCGNGIRCVAKYVVDKGLTDKNEFDIDTLSGIKHIKTEKGENGETEKITVDMGAPILNGKDIPTLFDMNPVINAALNLKTLPTAPVTCVSMGNPHCVVFCSDIENLNLEKIGPEFEFNPMFPERINTEFIRVLDENTLEMRVWERGSGETFACGTGACAAAVAAILGGFCKKNTDITVKLSGGELTIRWTDETVFMTGGAVFVCDGELYGY